MKDLRFYFIADTKQIFQAGKAVVRRLHVRAYGEVLEEHFSRQG
jgi:hypothetical protein